jgi:hypothetical protein
MNISTTTFGLRQLPAHKCAACFVIVPIRDPGIGQQARRNEFEHLPFAEELAHSVDVQLSIPGSEAPFSSRPRVHLKELGLAFVIAPPAQQLPGIGERLKYPLGWCIDVYFANDCILIGGENGLCHS